MITAALDHYARISARRFEDRQATVGASEIGACLRRVWYLKREGQPGSAPRNPDYVDSWGATTRGRIYEEHFWVPALRHRFGRHLRYAGKRQRTLVLGKLSATPDSLVTGLPRDALKDLGVDDIGTGRCVVVEAKTIDPRIRLDGMKPEHAFQLQIQLNLFHTATKHRPEYAVITYADSSYWDATQEFVVRRDPRIFATARARADAILTARSAGELKPEGWISGGSECAYCPFSQACSRERTGVPAPTIAPPPDAATLAVAEALARIVKEREVETETAIAAHRTAVLELKDLMRTEGRRRIETPNLTINWSAVKGRPSFDMKAIRQAAAAAGIDLNQYETVGEPTDRLVIQDRRQSRTAA